MRITISHDIFDTQSAYEDVALVQLFMELARGPQFHALLTDPLYLPGRTNGSIDSWLNSHSYAAALRAVLNQGLIIAAGPRTQPTSDSSQPRRWHLPGALEVQVERRSTSDWSQRRLTVHDTIDLLREPVRLQLENERTELGFVMALAGPTNGGTLRQLMNQPGRFELHGGGGGEIKMRLEGLMEGPPTARTWRQVLRTWVLFDQDSGDPDARSPSASALALMNTCESVTSTYGLGLSWICLQRREIESYVPDSGLIAEHRSQMSALVNTVIAWRASAAHASWAWAFDLKKGLHGDRHQRWKNGLSDVDIDMINKGTRPPDPHMLKSPFDALPPTDILALQRGFGERLGLAFRASVAPPWAADLPAEFDRGPLGEVARLSLVQSIFDRV